MNIVTLVEKLKPVDSALRQNHPNISDREATLARLAKITEETGELANEILGSLKLQRQEKLDKSQQESLTTEWADAVLTLFLLGIHLKIDISKVLVQRLKSVRKRYNLS